MPTLAILTFVSTPFGQDIREGVLGVMSYDWLFDFLLAVGSIGLVILLVLKSGRAARACEGLREQMQEDLASHRNQFKEDLANYRKQLQEDLAPLVDSKLKPITDSIGTLQSNGSALNSRLHALESRIAALESRITALTEAVVRFTNTN